jgi:hypothetical protein
MMELLTIGENNNSSVPNHPEKNHKNIDYLVGSFAFEYNGRANVNMVIELDNAEGASGFCLSSDFSDARLLISS